MACASTAPKVIDGSVLEGGGQILRIASALSCLTNQPITVQNIRAGRSNPGLRPQHMTGLQLLRDLSSGDLRGDSVGSTEITLTPSEIKGGKYVADTKTAGSIVLLLQASMPCMMFAAGAVNINLTGGTNATMAPQIDYTTLVFQPTVSKFGVYFDCDVIRRGYYPKGGGEIEVRTNPVDSLQAVNIMDVGRLTKIEGRAFVAGVLPVKIAHSMAKTAREILESRYRSIPVNIISIQEDSAVGNGSGIIVVAETSTGCKLAGSALGKRGILAEQVGKEAAEMLSKNLDQGGCVDEYLQDQLILFMALAQGKSRILTGPVTLHTLTAIHITGKLTQAKFKVTNTAADGSATTNIIECEGIGLQR